MASKAKTKTRAKAKTVAKPKAVAKTRARKKATKKAERDLEKAYSVNQFVTKLRRLADSLEQKKSFRIQVAGERISIPSDAIVNIEHEREGDKEEVEFQLKWQMADE